MSDDRHAVGSIGVALGASVLLVVCVGMLLRRWYPHIHWLSGAFGRASLRTPLAPTGRTLTAHGEETTVSTNVATIAGVLGRERQPPGLISNAVA